MGDEAVGGGDGFAKGEEGALGIEDAGEVYEAVEELVLGEVVGFGGGGFGGKKGFAAGVFAGVGGKGGTEFGNGGEDGLLVEGKGLFLEFGLDADVGADGAAVEEGKTDDRKEVPDFVGRVEEVGGGEGFKADGTGECEGRIAGGFGGGEEVGLGEKKAFGAEDVGSAAKEVSRNANKVLGRDFGDRADGNLEIWRFRDLGIWRLG